MNIEKALTPSSLYEETVERFELYWYGELNQHDLNLPSFTASFPPSPKCFERVFPRKLMIDEEDILVYYDSYIVIDQNSLDPVQA